MLMPGLILALRMSEAHDKDLAIRLQRRDPDAMADLYDRFGRMAWSVIVAIVRDEAAAEDLVEETFLRVWNRMQAFDTQRGALGPWLLAIARDRAIDWLRSRSGGIDRNAWELDVREHPLLFVNSESDVLNGDHPRIMRKAIAGLNAGQQKAIELAYYEGLSQTEIAERMGEPPDTVTAWMRSALRHVREQLGQEEAA